MAIKIGELMAVTSKAMVVRCFEEHTNTYDCYNAENKKKLNGREISMIECLNGEEINIFYVGSEKEITKQR